MIYARIFELISNIYIVYYIILYNNYITSVSSVGGFERKRNYIYEEKKERKEIRKIIVTSRRKTVKI